MYIIIENSNEIREYQEIFEKILKYNTEKINDCKFGVPGESLEAPLYWSSENQLWFATKKLDTRYWNAFGLEKPLNKNTKMVGQICFSLKGCRAEGKFIRETLTNKIYVGHSGKFRKIGKNYSDEKDIKTNKKIKNDLIIIDEKEILLLGELPHDELSYPEFQQKIKNLILEVYELKSIEKINTSNKHSPTENKPKTIILNKKNKDNFEIVNKAFRTILPSLANYIGNTLKIFNNNNWWLQYVIKKLPDTTTNNLPQKGTYEECVKSLDIQACLSIIINNWKDIFIKQLRNKNFLNWAYELKENRNQIDAHYSTKTIESFSNEDLKRVLDTMARFMEPINENISHEIREIKDN